MEHLGTTFNATVSVTLLSILQNGNCMQVYFLFEVQFKYYLSVYHANIYLLKVKNRNIRKKCEICSKLTIKTLRQNFTPFSSVSLVEFERVNVSCKNSCLFNPELISYTRIHWQDKIGIFELLTHGFYQ